MPWWGINTSIWIQWLHCCCRKMCLMSYWYHSLFSESTLGFSCKKSIHSWMSRSLNVTNVQSKDMDLESHFFPLVCNSKLTSRHTFSDLSGSSFWFCDLCLRLPVVSWFVALNSCWRRFKERHNELLNYSSKLCQVSVTSSPMEGLYFSVKGSVGYTETASFPCLEAVKECDWIYKVRKENRSEVLCHCMIS